MTVKFTRIEVLDTTLRDGAQACGVSFTLQDKIQLTLKLDEFGVDIVEGGWPASNPKDEEFFRQISNYYLRTQIAAFGSTRRKNIRVEKDANLKSILDAKVKTAVLVGKAWDLHVTVVLGCTLDENLRMVGESIEFLHRQGLRTLFDAEHFFDGYKRNAQYAVRVVETAAEAGADVVVLCDTNGGTLPHEVFDITSTVRERVKAKLGIHVHNDAGCAVANTLMAVKAGVSHVQGTVNGIGERAGNADLCQVIPNLKFKLGLGVLNMESPREPQLYGLTQLSRYVAEMTSSPQGPYQPYVGKYAFAHKGGIHVDAVLKIPNAYEHISPGWVGNIRNFATSELSGRMNILAMASKLGLRLEKDDAAVSNALNRVKELELEGYSLDIAEGTVYLILAKCIGCYREYFRVKKWNVTTGSTPNGEAAATVYVAVAGGETSAESVGVGPVHALDIALRKALSEAFKAAAEVRLVDYRVSIVGGARDTASRVRVLIEFTDNQRRWITTAASANIVEASLTAITDGYDYYLQTSTHQYPIGK